MINFKKFENKFCGKNAGRVCGLAATLLCDFLGRSKKVAQRRTPHVPAAARPKLCKLLAGYAAPLGDPIWDKGTGEGWARRRAARLCWSFVSDPLGGVSEQKLPIQMEEGGRAARMAEGVRHLGGLFFAANGDWRHSFFGATFLDEQERCQPSGSYAATSVAVKPQDFENYEK